MDDRQAPLIFDGHNDVLLKLYLNGGVSAASEFLTGLPGAIDFPKAQKGGFGGGFFAVYVPSPADDAFSFEDMMGSSYDLPLPDPVDWSDAIGVAMSQAATLFELERLGALKVCKSVADIRASMDAGIIAAIFHIEGAEAIDADLGVLDVLYNAGLRSLGPVWSRSTVFGRGVPFRFPGSPDTGEGLTDLGLKLVRRCNEFGILLDLSHMNEAGFWDVAKHSDAPLVATHSNVHMLCPTTRNLTDKQLAAIRDSDGMVGVNFAVSFLREDGRMLADVPLDTVLRHLDYLIETLGEDRVGFGSDYDGAIVPEELTTIADLPNLRQAMSKHGYDDALMKKLCSENWMRVLERTWGE
jgi:membrane dipeptidase